MRALAAITAVALAAGCSSSGPSPDSNALTGPTYFRRICVSTLNASDWTLAVATAVNESDGLVTLEGTALTDSEGIELVGSDVIRPGDLVDTFGVWNGSPPRGMTPLDRRLWRSREPVEGNQVEPGEKVNFLLHLRGADGTESGPLEVTYHSESGKPETYKTNVQYVIERDCGQEIP
jgi:hypothetical protein